jgi:hypothetical protein
MRTVESGGEPGRLSSAAHHGALARMAHMQGVANYGARFFSIVSDARVVWPGMASSAELLEAGRDGRWAMLALVAYK